MAESSAHNVKQDMRIEEHERRIGALEESTQSMVEAQTAMMAQMEITNGLLKQCFELMKKLAVGIVGALTVVKGGSQVVM